MPKKNRDNSLQALLKARMQEENENPPLIQACRKGLLEEVKRLLEDGANVNCVDFKGSETALMVAVSIRNIDIVRSLLKGGADVNFGTDHGTPLKAAVTDGFPELCQILLESGASPSIKTIEKWCIPYCCKKGFFGVLKVLLEFLGGAKGNIVYKKTTPMILAATHGHFELVRLLIEQGGVNFERQGERALVATCAGGDFSNDNYIEIVKLLLRQNLDVNNINEMGKTALCEAALNTKGGENVVKLLLQHGALFEVDIMKIPGCFDRDSSSPLAGAVKHGYIDMVRLLLDLGADVNEIWRRGVDPSATKLGPGGTDISMLMLACKNASLVRVAKELLDRGADVNLRNSAGNTALHVAVHSDFRTWASRVKAPRTSSDRHYDISPRAQPDTIRLLLQNGSSVMVQNQDGETPLDICMEIISSREILELEDDSLVALSYLLKADSKHANRQDVLSKLWEAVKRRFHTMDVEIMEETIRVLVAAGVKPSPQLMAQVSDYEPHNPLEQRVLALLNHCSKNPATLSDVCRTQVRVALRSPLIDVHNVSLGLSVPLRRFLIMDDLELFVSGHPKLQLLNSCPDE